VASPCFEAYHHLLGDCSWGSRRDPDRALALPTGKYSVTVIAHGGAAETLTEGYPEPPVPPGAQMVEHKHMHIGGFPATQGRLNVTPWGGTASEVIYFYLYVPDGSLLYSLLSGPESPDFDQRNREMQEIIASFHIEKVGQAGKQ